MSAKDLSKRLVIPETCNSDCILYLDGRCSYQSRLLGDSTKAVPVKIGNPCLLNSYLNDGRKTPRGSVIFHLMNYFSA